MCANQDLNLGPRRYKLRALPTELLALFDLMILLFFDVKVKFTQNEFCFVQIFFVRLPDVLIGWDLR
jgi:hypothetical protein